MKDSKSKGRPEGKGLNSPLIIKGGATGCVILEQDFYFVELNTWKIWELILRSFLIPQRICLSIC